MAKPPSGSIKLPPSIVGNDLNDNFFNFASRINQNSIFKKKNKIKNICHFYVKGSPASKLSRLQS